MHDLRRRLGGPTAPVLLCVLVILHPSSFILSAVTVEQAEIGFEGRFTAGCWAPVTVRLRADEPIAGTLELSLADCDDMTPVYPCAVRLKANEPQVVRALVRPRYATRQVEARLVRSRGATAHRFVIRAAPDKGPVEQGERLIVAIGRPAGLAEALAERRLTGRYVLASVADVAALPARWIGYEGVWAVVWATGRSPGAVEHLTKEQRTAVTKWVGMGGRAVLSVGSAWRPVGAAAGLEDLLPGTFGRTDSVRAAGRLESFADTNAVFPAQAGLSVALVDGALKPASRVRVGAIGNVPLVVARPHRFGLATVVTFDVDAPPFADWKGNSAFWIELLELPTSLGSDRAGRERQVRAVTRESFGDVSIDVKGHIDHFEGVRLIPFGLVALLVFLYIVLIGPVDYFFLKKGLGRLELTWITFLAMVVGTSLAGYGVATASKGRTLRVRQLDLVDVDAASRTSRGTTWWTVFSSRNAAYDLSLDRPGAIVTWLGKPTTSLGGTYRRGGLAALQAGYRHSPALDRLLGVPIRMWATKSFEGRWHADVPYRFPCELRVGFRQRLAGRLTNDSGLDLADCYLMHGKKVYMLGDLPAGRTQRLDRNVQRRDLASWLERRREDLVIDDVEDSPQLVRYEPGSHDEDPSEPLQVMMFYGRVPGRRLTTPDGPIRSDRYTFLDGSFQLDAGHHRAVLIGTAGGGGATVRIEPVEKGQAVEVARRVVLRAFLPVEPGRME